AVPNMRPPRTMLGDQMNSDDEAQDRIVKLASSIMAILAGVKSPEADTALTLAVTTAICLAAPNDPALRLESVEGFAQSVREFVQRDDIVDWIKASIIHAPQAGRA